MGLDMYLEARRYISPIDKETEPLRRAIEAAIGREPATEKPHGEPELLEVCAVVVRVGYWRKFWPLHNWFVNNAQDGHDDCRPAFINPSTLEELEETARLWLLAPAAPLNTAQIDELRRAFNAFW